MTQPTGITEDSGTVEQTNDNGFRLNGNWINYSQYGYHGSKYQPNTETPKVGQFVTVQLKNGKFIHDLHMGGQQPASNGTARPAPQQQPPQQPYRPAPQPTVTDLKSQLMDLTRQTRMDLLKVMAVASPLKFNLDDAEELTEIVRTLEKFVLEDLIAAVAPPDDDDLAIEDLADEGL